MPEKLGRISTLVHRATGSIVKTPLLVPSFSSKGFRIPKKGPAEVQHVLEVSAQFITEAYLLSAYDVHHAHVPSARELPFRPSIMILDSGGYEVSDDKDLSEVREPARGGKPWDLEKWHSIVSAWPSEFPTILVSYDHPDNRKSLEQQIEDGRDAFCKYRNHLCTLLLKPESKDAATLHRVLGKLASEEVAKELRSFDVIGVTEKELGSNTLERMVQIANLRRALDRADVSAVIHVFGSLDPLGACLYFLAGAEIFDGLTWIRYAYRDGMCVYIDNAAVAEMDRFPLSLHHDQIRGHIMRDNLLALELMKEHLTQFYHSQQFETLGSNAVVLHKAAAKLNARLNPGGA